MSKRVMHKDVELKGRKFRIGKFDALTGSYVAYKVMGQMIPSMGVIEPGKKEDQIAKLAQGIMSGKNTMNKREFIELQRDCLAVCTEVTKAGGAETPIAVMLANGAWGVQDLEYDVPTVIALTVHALMFNVSGFFDGSVPEVDQQSPDLSQPGAKM